MKNRIFIFTVVLILAAASPLFCQFQDADLSELPEYIGSRVRLRTENGATFQGNLYEVNDEFVAIIDRDGRLVTILRSAVTDAETADPQLDKKSYFQDSAANRLLVMPTGFPMEPGEFHIADQEIAAVTMSYGVNSNFSLWGGISIPGAIVSARYIMKTGSATALSLGSFAGVSWIEFTGILIPYAIFSVGAPEDNFTLGSGAVFAFDESSFDLEAAVLTLGGKTVLSDTTAIVTETWIIWGEMQDYSSLESEQSTQAWDPVPIIAVPGVAFRIAGEKFSWDIGAVLPLTMQKESGRYQLQGLFGEDGFIPIPLLSLTYRID